MPPRHRKNNLKKASQEEKASKDLTAKKGTTELPCVHSKPVKKPRTRCADKLKVASKVKAKIFDDNKKTVIKPITLGKRDGLSTINITNDFNRKCVDDTQSEVNNETLNSNNSSPKKKNEASKDLTAKKGTTELPCVHSKPVKKPRTRSADKLKVDNKVKGKIFDDNKKTVIKPITLGKRDGLSTVNISNDFNRKCVDDAQSEVNNETLNSNNSSPEKSRLSFNESMTRELSITVEKYEECSPCKKVKKSVESFVSSNSSESEWEEVEDNLENSLEDYKPNIPEGGVEITLEHPMLQKRHKREFDMAEFIRVQLNRFKKSVQLSIHKVHILCLISHGVYLNNILNSPDLKGMAFSQIPVEMLEIRKNHSKVNIDLIHKIVECFRSLFLVDCNFVPFGIDLMQNLTSNFEMKKANNGSLYNTMFVVFARALGMNVRLCYSMCPLSHKPSDLLLKKSKKLEPGDLVNTSFKSEENASVLRSCKIIESTASRQKEKIPLNLPTTSIVSTEGKNDEKELKLNSSKTDTKSSLSYKYSKEKVVARQQLKRKKKRVSYKISSDESMNNDKDNDGDFVAGEESDDDFRNVKHSSSSKKKKTPKVVRKAKQTERQAKNTNRKILSDDSNDDEPTTCLEANGIEYWAEVYSKAAKRWVPVECSCNIIDEPYILEDVARQPITYILAFDDKSHIKDVTKRYCAEWLTRCRQLRIDLDWWDDTLRPYHPPNNKQNKEEEEQMEKELCRKPLPTTISEFKNHPLYVLSRHLLKYEAIYPSDAPTLGFIKNEPIYARECVHTLRSRETWMKEARVVRVGEEAYKVVKRPKWDKVNKKILKDVPLELFGYWQTEKFVPPTAHDGIVPKNEYGNVELFKSCMLPKGTVHLQLPGLNRIARKLGIDCCPALVGFDIHTRGVHPVFDGWIICKEFKKTMEEAWAEEQVNIKKREVERRDKRVYGNWKKLIRGLLIKERIKVKYAIK